MSDPGKGPRVAIPGDCGVVIGRALERMTTHCGEIEIRIQKKRAPRGGYTYVVTQLQPPDNPV